MELEYTQVQRHGRHNDPSICYQPNQLVKPTPTSSAFGCPPHFVLRRGLPRALADSMAKNDHELVQNMTRVQISEKQVIVEVAVIDWPHPHEPRISWVLASTLPLSSTSTSIDAARSKLMNNRNFFALCEECGERKSKGHMFSGKICMSCAERNHGVVY